MIKKIGLKVFLPIIIVAAIAIPLFVDGKDYGATYDTLFGGEGFVIHTNEEMGDEIEGWKFRSIVQEFAEFYASATLYEGDTTYNYRPAVEECNVDTRTCDIVVQKVIDKGNWEYDYQEFKKYDDVSIIVNNDVMNYFGTILNSNGDMILKYDESMFANEDDKLNYIRDYVIRKQFTNSDGEHVSFDYNSNEATLTYKVHTTQFYEGQFMARTVVKSVQFDNSEVAYSDDFKHLTTDGNITIKANGDLTKEIVSEYLNSVHIYSGTTSVHFNLDGNVVNNKAYVEMVKSDVNGNEMLREKHLITIIKDTNVDKSKFNMVNMRDVINIPADEPAAENLSAYISYFMQGMNYRQVDIDDTTYYSFDFVGNYAGSEAFYVKYTKYVNGEVEDIQFNNISFNFTGYSDEYSNKYAAKYKNGMVVRSDEKGFWAVSSNLEYEYTVLACNEDTSVCDIALSHRDEKRMEIHKVNITFDDSISDKFKRLFNLNDDGTIDIVTDSNLDDIGYFSYYTYNEDEGASLSLSREGNKLVLSVNSYTGNDFEKHSVVFNKVNSPASTNFKNRVYMTKDFYPGENNMIWNNLSYNYYFSKYRAGNNSANTIGCDISTSTCKVMIMNDQNKLEIHDVKANIKEGKSPEFAAAFPEDSVVFNAIYKDDEAYLYGASQAYFMSRTKDSVYLHGFTEDSAIVAFNELETHSFKVDYTEANEDYAKEVAEAKKKLKNADLATIRSDLEFVNKFYYGSEDFFAAENFNSKTLNENFNKAVKNKHIGYFVVPEGGGGMPYMNGAAGRMVLFYDGVAYDILDGHIDFTNYNIIYVPNNTTKSPEEYVKAAQKRVDEYLGKDSGVVISYNGPVEEGVFEDDNTYEMFGINKNNFDHNEYQISYRGKSDVMLIVADSSKIQKPDFAASDVTNNINVTSETVNYPSNTVVMSDVIDRKDSEFSKILEKAKVKNAHIVDINLYSSSVGDIDDFDGAEFNVSVPIDDEDLHDKELVAYYIDDEGNVEEHPVVMDEFMATFETTHFSTYIIAEKASGGNIGDAAEDIIQNPNTGDGILTYILLLVISGLVITGASYRFIKREN